jgi:hypothetical protein
VLTLQPHPQHLLLLQHRLLLHPHLLQRQALHLLLHQQQVLLLLMMNLMIDT